MQTKTLRPLNNVRRAQLFGTFAYEPDPLPDNPEHIKVTDDWAKNNLETIELPLSLQTLVGIERATFHSMVAPKFLALVHAWEDAGVISDVIQWGGSYAPRFIRRSTTVLSAHAWASAFDINVAWNPLGSGGAPAGSQGSVLRLVPIAEACGWFWGGRFKKRPDPMHFELARLDYML